MAAAPAQPRVITPEEVELISFLRQNIVHKLCQEAAEQGRARTDPRVIQAMVRYFNLGQTPHGVFDCLMWTIAHSFLGEFHGF